MQVMRRSCSWFLAALAMFGTACGGDAKPTAPAPVLTTVTVSLASSTVQVGSTVTATASGRDQNGQPIGTGVLAWSTDNAAIATVTASGEITTLRPGQVSIVATGAGGRVGQAALTITPGAPAVMVPSVTASLTGTAGTALGTPPTVTVRDVRGFPVPNVSVTFTARGGSAVATPTVPTNADGVASPGSWTLAPLVGTNTLEVSAGSLVPVVFTAVSVAGPPATVVPVGSTALNGTVGATTLDVPRVLVRDAFGNNAQGATVGFAAEAGSVASAQAVVGADGVASAGAWTLGTTAGVQRLVARVGTVAPVTFTASVSPDVPAALQAVQGQEQRAPVASAVGVAPTVRVRDRYGNPVPGVPVRFTVAVIPGAQSSGVVAQPSAVSDSLGIASGGAWTLGTRAGTQRLDAQVANAPIASFTAIADPGPPQVYGFVRGASQIEAVETNLPEVPVVRVVDRFGNPVPRIPVTFTVAQGGGTIGSAGGSTDDGGLVSPQSWRLGSETGYNVLRGEAPGFEAISIRARAVPRPEFPVDVRYVPGGTPSPAIQALVNAAVARFRKLFVFRTSSYFAFNSAGRCGTNTPAYAESVPGVLIWVDIRPIDGRGGTLGSAGPCEIRSTDITAVGTMRLDAVDLEAGLTDGTAFTTVLHEMLHIMGFGGFWRSEFLVSGTLTSDPWFNGAFARLAFLASGGSSTRGPYVPVENIGGSGTVLVHWRTSLMSQELMTGYACGGPAPLSFITLSSFFDLGISVAAYGDDDYTVTYRGCAGNLARAVEEPFTVVPIYRDERGGMVTETAMSRRRQARLRTPMPPRAPLPVQVLERTRR